MKALIRSRFTWLFVLAAVAFGAALAVAALLDENTKAEDLFNQDLYDSYLARRVTTEADVVADYEWEQVMYMPLLLPDPEHVLFQNGSVLPVLDWSGFSDTFIKGLVPVVRDGVTTYPIWVMEDAGVNPRRRLILNAKDEVIAELPVPKDYDPAWWVKEHYPELYGPLTSMADSDYRAYLESLFDGSRLAMDYELIDHDNLLKLVLNQSIATALQEEEEGGGMMMMGWGGGSVTNIQFVEIERVDTNGTMSVTVAFPDDFTNRISLIVCTNLLVQDWSLLVTTNPPSGTNTFTYVDSAAAGYNVRFYHAYNADADSDGDGVPDVDEVLDGTDPDDPDDPPNVGGTVSYSGLQTGPIRVIAVTSSGSWSTNNADVLASPGAYIIPKLSPGSYYIKAWKDEDSDGQLDTNDARVEYAGNPVTVNGQVTDINLTLVDVDSDSDGLPDWWELLYFNNLAQTPSGDLDVDALSNLGEYLAGSDPNDVDTDDDGMGDAAEVAHGLPPATSNDFAALPYSENFEALSEAYLNNQGGWVCAPTDAVVVQTNEVNGGSHAAEFLAATVTSTADQFIAAQGETNVWIDFRAKIDPRAVTWFGDHPDIADAPAYEPCVFAVNRRGEVWAYDGTEEAWTNDARFILTEYQWHRFTVRENYNDHTWDLFVDSIRVFSGLGFRQWLDPYVSIDKNIQEFSRFTVAAARGGGWYVDDISVGTTQPEGLCGELQTTNIRVSVSSSDDADENAVDGTMNLGRGKLQLANDIVGLRFQALPVTSAAIPVRTYVEFVSQADRQEESSVRIECESTNDAPTFATSLSNITSRATTEHSVTWTPPGWADNQTGFRQRTPDLSALVHDVVSLDGWQSGNNIVFIFTDTGGTKEREARSSEDGADFAPLLHVEWAEPLE